MTQRESIELVQQHHPHMREKEIRLLLNRAQDDFCQKTDIIDASFRDVTVKDKRYYFLGSSILKVRRIDVDNNLIPRIHGQLAETDIDSEGL